MSKKILIIDDDTSFLESAAALLESNGYTAFTADNARDGMKMAKLNTPQLIILDVMMAHITEGFMLSRQLKEEACTREIPVLMVSGIRKAQQVNYTLEPDPDWLPVKAFMEKPLKPVQLLDAVLKNIA